jgi:hypothetical protein
VDRARDGFLTVRLLAAFFLGTFFLGTFFLGAFLRAAFFLAGFFLAEALLADFFAFVRAFRRATGFLAFALEAFRFLPFDARLALVVLVRLTRLAFARFFFIAPVLPPLAWASTRLGEPYRRSAALVKTVSGNLSEFSSSIASWVTILCFTTDGWSRFWPWTRCTRIAPTPPRRGGSATSICAFWSSARKPT